jgi:cyclopropane fatty-acyl-phospholipid synthase-like methyltransferase
MVVAFVGVDAQVITCDINNLTAEVLGVTPAGSLSATVSSVAATVAATVGSKKGGKGKKAADDATTSGSDEKEVKQSAGIGTLIGGFDRVISIEMFEHMKNYEKLFARVASWVKPDTGMIIHSLKHWH